VSDETETSEEKRPKPRYKAPEWKNYKIITTTPTVRPEVRTLRRPRTKKAVIGALVIVILLVVGLYSLHSLGLLAPSDVTVTGSISPVFSSILFAAVSPCSANCYHSVSVNDGKYSVILSNFANYTFTASGNSLNNPGWVDTCSGFVYVSSLFSSYDFSPFCIVW